MVELLLVAFQVLWAVYSRISSAMYRISRWGRGEMQSWTWNARWKLEQRVENPGCLFWLSRCTSIIFLDNTNMSIIILGILGLDSLWLSELLESHYKNTSITASSHSAQLHSANTRLSLWGSSYQQQQQYQQQHTTSIQPNRLFTPHTKYKCCRYNSRSGLADPFNHTPFQDAGSASTYVTIVGTPTFVKNWDETTFFSISYCLCCSGNRAL